MPAYRFCTTWVLEADRERVWDAVYDWNVRTTKAWMNLFAPVARPIFRANHDWVMRNGGKGLAKLLGARLLLND